MKQYENILSIAAAVLLAPMVCLPLVFLLAGMFFPHEAEDYWPFAEMAAALVLTIIAIPFLFRIIRKGIRRTFE